MSVPNFHAYGLVLNYFMSYRKKLPLAYQFRFDAKSKEFLISEGIWLNPEDQSSICQGGSTNRVFKQRISGRLRFPELNGWPC